MRVRTTRWLRGSVERVVAMTPYEVQTIVEGLCRAGRDTTVEVLLPAEAPDEALARAEQAFARLRRGDVTFTVGRAGEGAPADDTAATSRTAADLALLTARLVHELQGERALAAAGAGGEERTLLETQWRATDDALAAWCGRAVAIADGLAPRARQHADGARARALRLPALRANATDPARAPRALEEYTQLTVALLATLGGLASGGPAASAHLALLHAHEEAAQAALAAAGASAPAKARGPLPDDLARAALPRAAAELLEAALRRLADAAAARPASAETTAS